MTEPVMVSSMIHEEIKSLTKSIDQMVKSFKSLQKPVEESRIQVPEATIQLERINSQTEEATHRVLDMVEQITNDAGNMLQDLNILRKSLPATYFKNRSKVRDAFERIEKMASSSQENAFAIMDALQFQDITSQQIEHTAELLEEVETKLHSIKGFFSGDNKSNAEDDVIVHKKRVFDPNARYEVSSGSQQVVDDLLENVSEDQTE
jgi:chemotaxis regulatin CheY-phosphate phosphatase CheZ